MFSLEGGVIHYNKESNHTWSVNIVVTLQSSGFSYDIPLMGVVYISLIYQKKAGWL